MKQSSFFCQAILVEPGNWTTRVTLFCVFLPEWWCWGIPVHSNKWGWFIRRIRLSHCQKLVVRFTCLRRITFRCFLMFLSKKWTVTELIYENTDWIDELFHQHLQSLKLGSVDPLTQLQLCFHSAAEIIRVFIWDLYSLPLLVQLSVFHWYISQMLYSVEDCSKANVHEFRVEEAQSKVSLCRDVSQAQSFVLMLSLLMLIQGLARSLLCPPCTCVHSNRYHVCYEFRLYRHVQCTKTFLMTN